MLRQEPPTPVATTETPRWYVSVTLMAVHAMRCWAAVWLRGLADRIDGAWTFSIELQPTRDLAGDVALRCVEAGIDTMRAAISEAVRAEAVEDRLRTAKPHLFYPDPRDSQVPRDTKNS